MTDRYAKLRAALPTLVEEARRQGGTNPRAQMIIDLLADHDRLRDALVRIASPSLLLSDGDPSVLRNAAVAALAQEQGESDGNA